MYLLFLRNGVSANNKQLTVGRIEKRNSSKNEFAIIPGTVKKIDFDYGDKITCVHGNFMVVIHIDGKMVEPIQMYNRYWMPNNEVTLTEAYMEEHKVELPVLPLTGVNHRVMTGLVTR